MLARFQFIASFSLKTIVKYDVLDAPTPQNIVFYDVFATPMSAIFPKSVQNHRKTHAFRAPSGIRQAPIRPNIAPFPPDNPPKC